MSVGPLFFVSILAGLVGAMSGVGGGVVLVPVLTFYGLDIKRAIALSLLSTIAVSNGAAAIYLRRHLPNLKISAFMEGFGVAGSLVGATLTILAARRLLFFLCGGLLIACTGLLWRQRARPWQPVTSPDRLARWWQWSGSYYDRAEQRTIAYHGTRAALGGVLMLAAGFISGLVGLGSTGLTVLIHDVILRLPPKVSLTTSNLVIGVVALAGACLYLEAGLIDPPLAVAVILGVPIGALLGTQWLIKLTNQTARTVCLLVLLVLGIELVINGMVSRP